MATFPSPEWVQSLKEKLNSDERYAEIAKKWEWDLLFQVEPGGNLTQPIGFYLDLWHGKCREAFVMDETRQVKPAFVLKVPYENGVKVLKGEMEVMTALLTRKVGVQGNMAIMMRNVPVVLDFLRCCREVTDSFV